MNLSAVTNADGEYTFAELIPGAYTITSPATSGYTATGTEAGSLGGTPGTDSISDITIAPGDLGDGYLLGRSAQLTVSGRVFLDRNANGAVDSVDTLLSGIRVTLTGTASTGESITRQATTNARGAYAFPRISPDGRSIAVATDDGKEANVWTYDLSGTSPVKRLTFTRDARVWELLQ